MTKLTLEIHDDIVSTLSKLQNLNDSGVELEIPEGSILFENVLNLKLIKKHGEKFGTTVHFITNYPAGNDLIEMTEEGNTKYSFEQKTNEVDMMEPAVTTSGRGKFAGLSTFFSKFRLPSFGRAKKGLPKIPYTPVVIALLLILLFHFDKTKREATIKITINSQPLTRSVTVKVKANTPTDPATKILAGTNVKATVDVTKETPTTGEKLEGETATGKAKIYNKTTEDTEFDEKTVLTYDAGEEDLNYVTQDKVTVPAAAPQDPLDPGSPLIPGNIEVAIEAETFGAEYNIDKEKTLGVKGEKKSDFAAETVDKVTGGKSETIKIVAAADITKVGTLLDQEITNQSSQALSGKIGVTQSLVAGSPKSTLIKETPDHKLADETEKLSVNRIVEVEGLVYLKSELDRLLDNLVKEFIPGGFVLSSKDREVKADVLGNSTGSILSSTEADIQVTLKTFVVPDITEDSIKNALAGKSSSEAQKYLGSIQNVKTFEFKLERGFIPIFNSVPKKLDNIKVEIVRE